MQHPACTQDAHKLRESHRVGGDSPSTPAATEDVAANVRRTKLAHSNRGARLFLLNPATASTSVARDVGQQTVFQNPSMSGTSDLWYETRSRTQ